MELRVRRDGPPHRIEGLRRAFLTQVARELLDIARSLGLSDPATLSEQVLDKGTTTESALWFHVREARQLPWGDPVATDLGFTPTVSVGFQQNLAHDAQGQQDDMVSLTSGLLKRIPGDAELHYQFEDIWLLRRGDELSLSERDTLWPPQRLALISQPYHRATYALSDED